MSNYTIISPVTEKPVKDIHLADVAETDAIIFKAAHAFESWRKVNPHASRIRFAGRLSY